MSIEAIDFDDNNSMMSSLFDQTPYRNKTTNKIVDSFTQTPARNNDDGFYSPSHTNTTFTFCSPFPLTDDRNTLGELASYKFSPSIFSPRCNDKITIIPTITSTSTAPASEIKVTVDSTKLSLSKIPKENLKSDFEDVDSENMNSIQQPSLSQSMLSPPLSAAQANALAKAKSEQALKIIVCNCKKSKCLKLYCECFQALRYCNGCNCMDCNNDESHEAIRNEAIRITKEKNRTAFQIKIDEEVGRHFNGCHCKQSKCLKKYCECFNATTFCGENCKCMSCSNYEGSKDLENLLKYAGSADGKESKKRKESPTSVAIATFSPLTSMSSRPTPTLDSKRSSALRSLSQDTASATKPPKYGLRSKTHQAQILAQQKVESDDSDESFPKKSKSMSLVTTPTIVSPTDISAVPGSLFHQIINNSKYTLSTPSTLDIVRQKSASTPASAMVITSNITPRRSSRQASASNRQKNSEEETKEFIYPFFGDKNAKIPKVIALMCLNYLSGKDFYHMSVVNSLWSATAQDDALWE